MATVTGQFIVSDWVQMWGQALELVTEEGLLVETECREVLARADWRYPLSSGRVEIHRVEVPVIGGHKMPG